MDARPIGMFDSGVGGLTVFSEVVKKMPNEDIIYLGDTKRFPYGGKSTEAIIQLSRECTRFLLNKGAKVVVIACGTATSQALKVIQKEFKNTLIVGIIEPTVMQIIKNKELQKIGVIATEGTIRSNAWENEIKKYNNKIKVLNQSCPLLAPMAEEGWISNEIAKLTIKEYLKKFKEEEIDEIILGCTHYPLYKTLIKEELDNKVEIINPGEKIGNYLYNVLKENKLLKEDSTVNYKIYLTDIECKFVEIASRFLKKKEIITNNIIKTNI